MLSAIAWSNASLNVPDPVPFSTSINLNPASKTNFLVSSFKVSPITVILSNPKILIQFFKQCCLVALGIFFLDIPASKLDSL